MGHGGPAEMIMPCSDGLSVMGAEDYSVYTSFEDMDLKEGLLRGIYSYGFETPSAIQQRGIMPVIDGRDMIGQAQSGTGKTAAFLIGVLQRIDPSRRSCQALLLAPTRELALQIQTVALALGDYLGVSVHACIGGTARDADRERLREGPQLVIG